MDCDGCAKHVNAPNYVPYGDATVREDCWECSEGWPPGGCPEGAFVPDEPHYAVRGCGFSEAELEAGDYYGDLGREDRYDQTE